MSYSFELIGLMDKSVKVLGSEVALPDIPQIMAVLEDWLRAPAGSPCRQMIVTGFHGLYQAHKNAAYRQVARAADLWVPDGIAPVLVARIKGMRNVARTPGHEIVQAWLRLADERGYSSYFYGDTETTLAALCANVARDYPGHRIAGAYSPPFRVLSEAEDAEIVAKINAAKSDIVWVGLGCPKQDMWGAAHRARLNAKAVIGVGAVFGFLAGTVPRCPAFWGDHGLEWAYRLLKEPKKLWKRDLLEGPAFMGHVLLEQLGLRKYD